MDVRIVLLPEPRLDMLAKQYSERLAQQFPTLFTLDAKHIPHSTLLHIEMSEPSLDKIKDALYEIAASAKQIGITVDKALSDDGTFLALYFQNDTTIIWMREQILEKVAHTVDALHDRNRPHLTITRLKSTVDLTPALRVLNEFPKTTYLLPSLAVCEQTDNGACKNMLFAFDLQQ